MSEYIIDMGNSSYQSTSGLLCADVSQLREGIVRCRDCKYFYADRTSQTYWCDFFDDNAIRPDGFCAWGKKVNK